MILVSKYKFMDWLKENDYKDWSRTGYPSTILQYASAIERVMRIENIETWSDLTEHIQILCRKYSKFGTKCDYGQIGHATVINALRRFAEFLINEYELPIHTAIYFE